jgi:4'-phosphopantetheinyl transferase
MFASRIASDDAVAVSCAPGEVHVWRITLDCPARSVARLRATLSAEERERAARFHSLQLCERWTVARGALRCILATYSGAHPQSLAFRVGPYGKPVLVGPVEELSFSLSHTGGLALLAIGNTGHLGIDAETVRPGLDLADLSRHFFAPAETEEILGLSPEEQVAAFFACWTRKEAFVKALGTGLSLPLDRFQVTVRPDQPARLVAVDWDRSPRWSLVDVGEPGVAATLAVEGPVPVLRRFEFASVFG